jgi:hypothetical protein
MMQDWCFNVLRRRVALSVTLLFCFSLGWSQVKIERAIFSNSLGVEKNPFTILRLQHQPEPIVNFNENVGGLQFDRMMDSTVPTNAQNVSKDSLRVEAGATKTDTVSTGKSPTLAMLMSMVIPGSGQVYVHRYITIPIIWGFGYYFAKSWNDQNNRYIYFRDLFSASVAADTVNHQGNGVYQSNRDFYRDDRDKFAFYLAITYILNIVDAYVGASLYSFDVSDNLGGSAALRLRIPIQ